MLKALSSYQLFKSVEDIFMTQKREKNLILEPLTVIFRLAILKYKPPNTKLSIKDNGIIYQENTYDQGLIRMIEGDCREDLHNLYHPILKSIEWYSYNDYKFLYNECITGLNILNSVYDRNSTIRHTITHFISVIQMNDCENIIEDVDINPIIDKLKEIWTQSEINSAISLLKLIHEDVNRDIYLESLELILQNKEYFIHDLLKKISTEY
ncbi:MAG: hypothetical protein CMK44_01075 [Porticoccus sp.]|mgnify:CR=1 FL=1|nr:hypothetical protein [Porticoccus sp.]